MSKKYSFVEFLQQVKAHNDNYENIEIISTYIDTHSPLSCRCKICGNEWNVVEAKELYYGGCSKCGEIKRAKSKTFTHERYLNKLDEQGFDYSDIEFITKYEKNDKPIKCRCKICNYEWETTPTKLRYSQGCPYCNNQIVRIGYNDFSTVCSDKLKYIVNIKDVENCAKYSAKKILTKCPDCGFTKYMSLPNLATYGFACNVCGDGVSYPNKLARNIFKNLPVKNLHFEYQAEWSDNKLYDIYFEYNNKKYIVEMDGEWHFKDNSLSGQTKEEAQLLDDYKTKLATEHGISVIRIDCRESNYIYIRESILNSEIAELFDLSAIDWIECDKLSQRNLVKEICEYYNDHTDATIRDLSFKYNLSSCTIGRYLKKGTIYGWCNNSDVKNRAQRKANKKGIHIEVRNDNINYHCIFISMTECARQLTKLLGVSISLHKIDNRCKTGEPIGDYYFKKITITNNERSVSK